MATIAKVTNGASAASALNYALGKGQPMGHDTDCWLEEHQLERLDTLDNDRAVAVGGTNGIDPAIAKEQFKAVQKAFNQTRRRNQVLRLTQSFAKNELSALTPADWQRTNDLGVELAQRLYPDYQAVVYTHLDGQNHVLHNHIIVNKVNLITGKKMREPKGRAVERARRANDQIAQQEGWHILEPVREHQSVTEQALTQKHAYSYMHDLRNRIDTVMQDTAVSNFKTFSARLKQSGVNVSIRGQNVSYAFLDTNNKQRRARGKRLGTDYDKEALEHELARRTREQEQQLAKQDETRLTELTRATAHTDTALEQREREVDSSKSATASANTALKQREPAVAQLTNTSRQLDHQAKTVGTTHNTTRHRLRDAIKPIADGVQRLTKQVDRFISDRLAVLKQLTARNEQYEHAEKERKLADLTKHNQRQGVPKSQQNQPHLTDHRNRGGRAR